MKSKLLSAICASLIALSSANALLVDAVSVIVDKEPITIYEIFMLSKQYDISTKEALDVLIREKLELSQIKEMNIQVDDFDVTQQISDIAAKNKMGLQDFYNVLRMQGISLENYKKELKKKMQTEKLYQAIISSKYQPVNDSEAMLYYGKNQKEFTRFESFDVVKFESNNAQDLENVALKNTDDGQKVDGETKSNSALHMQDSSENRNVTISIQTIRSTNSDQAIVAALMQTDVEDQTQVIRTENGFVRFLVRSKNGEIVLPFEQVKNMIISKLSMDNEAVILKDHFETRKSRASITVIRLP